MSLYVHPLEDGIRIREQPVDGKPIGQVYIKDALESLESSEDTEKKIGVNGQWLNIKAPNGTIGYVAAWYVALTDAPATATGAAPSTTSTTAPAVQPSTSLIGMNLDMHHPLGHPDPALMKGIGWIRVKFNVSFNPDTHSYGNTDVVAAFNRTKPFIEQYVRAGMKCLVVMTHQLYGEGAGYDWNHMDTGRWNDLIPKYADLARRTAQLFAGTGLVQVYQIWNEQDTNPAVARAAVPIPASNYATMLAQTIRAIRGVDKTAKIITGGHVGGPGPGSAYARATLAALPGDVQIDGIASHPYGRGPAGHRFSIFGSLDEEVQAYQAVAPDRPYWITEWGVLDRQGDLSIVPDVAQYSAGFMSILKSKYAGKIGAAIWYAWADSMDNGYGLVGQDNRPKGALYNTFLGLG
jgi:hypothetical protein